MSSYTDSSDARSFEDDGPIIIRPRMRRQQFSKSYSKYDPTWQPPNTGFQGQYLPPDYPQNSLPGQQPQGNFWEQFDPGDQQQAGKSLVSTRRPWAPNTGQPPHLSPKRLEGPAANAADPAVTMGADHGVKADPEPPWPTYVPYPGPVATEKSGVQTGSPDKSPPEEPPRKEEIPGAATTRVDLVHDPSRANKDMSIRIELDAEEDWDDDLEEFCRLKRLGLIKEAKEQFWSALGHVNTMPYIRVQYAEMLQLSGDFKGFQNLDFLPEFPPSPTEETPDDRNRGKLVANYALLDLLSQRPIANYLTSAWGVVRHTLKALAAESTVGSTEIQLIVLCLRVLDYLKTCTHETAVGPAIIYASRLFNWRQLYHDLVGESCVWDFKDLFFASVSTFGWEKALVQFFETTYFPRALDSIIQDWTRPFYDEASVMGLLDLFTSLILKDYDSSMKPRNTLLLHHARTMAESAERNDPELMKTKPFVQWLLAKSVLELGNAPERPDGVRMEHFSGLRLNQGGGVHLPIYIPSRHARKPDWDMFFSRSTPAQRRVIEVAVRAADQLGDYSLQAEALKLLILQSQDPKQWMATLAQLQLDTQGDKEGYLATCLSRYLVATDPAEEATLLKDLERPKGPGNALYFEQCENASLTWAWSMIRVLLTTAHSDNSSVATGATEPSPFLTQGFSLDGSKLPPYVAEFARVELGIFVSESMGPLSLADLESTNASEVREDQKPPEQALRDRFARTIADPAIIGFENLPPLDPRGWAVDPANWPNSRPPPRAPAPPPAPPPKDPWNYYNYRQPNPLAEGITPNLEVKGWPKTWYEDAKRYAPSTPQRPVNDSDSDTRERVRIVERSDSDSEKSYRVTRKIRIPGRTRTSREPAYMARERSREEGRERRPYVEGDIFREMDKERQRERSRERARDEERERFDDSDSRLGNTKKKLSDIRLERWRTEGGKYEGIQGQTAGNDNSKGAKQEWNRAKTTHINVPHEGNGRQRTGEFRDRQEKGNISTELNNSDGGYSSSGSNGSEEGLHITVEDGATKLYFPSSHPGGNGTTVVLHDKRPRKSHAYVAGKDDDFETVTPDRVRRSRRTVSPPFGNKPESNKKTIPILEYSSSDAVGWDYDRYKKHMQMKFNARRKSPYAAEVKTEDEADRQEEREHGETNPLAPVPPPPPPAESEPKPEPKPTNTDTQPPVSKEDERQTAAAVTVAESKPQPTTELAAEPTAELATEPVAKPEAPPLPAIASTEPTTTTTKQQVEPENPWGHLWASSKKGKRRKALLEREPEPEPEPEPTTAGDDDWFFGTSRKRKSKRLDEFLSSISTQTPAPAKMPGIADGNADEQPAQPASNETLETPNPAPAPAPAPATIPSITDSKPSEQPSEQPSNETVEVPSPDPAPAPAPTPAPETEIETQPQPQPTPDPGLGTSTTASQQLTTATGWNATTSPFGWGRDWNWGQRPADAVVPVERGMLAAGAAEGDGDVVEVGDWTGEWGLGAGKGKRKMGEGEEGEGGKGEGGEKKEGVVEKREEELMQEERAREEERERARKRGLGRERARIREEEMVRGQDRAFLEHMAQQERLLEVIIRRQKKIREEEEAGSWFDKDGRPISGKTLVGDVGDEYQQNEGREVVKVGARDLMRRVEMKVVKGGGEGAAQGDKGKGTQKGAKGGDEAPVYDGTLPRAPSPPSLEGLVPQDAVEDLEISRRLRSRGVGG